MGRGDRRTEKGKRFKGSHGNTRPKSQNKKTRTTARKATTKK